MQYGRNITYVGSIEYKGIWRGTCSEAEEEDVGQATRGGSVVSATTPRSPFIYCEQRV